MLFFDLEEVNIYESDPLIEENWNNYNLFPNKLHYDIIRAMKLILPLRKDSQ